MKSKCLSIRLTSLSLPFICVIDILLFPYIRFLSCSLSMLLVLAWWFLHLNRISDLNVALVFITFAVLSTINGLLIYGSTSSIETTVIVIYAMLLTVYLKPYCTKLPIKKLLLIYLTIATILAIVYIVYPQLYFSIRSFWSMSNTEIQYTERIINRYTFLYSDPNNAACVLIAVMAYLITYEKMNMPQMIYCIAATCICVFATLSVTGVLIFVAVVCLIGVRKNRNSKKYRRTFLLLMVVLMIAVIFLHQQLIQGEMMESLMYRLTVNSSDNSMGGRTSIWRHAMEETVAWYNVIIGKGAVLDTVGKEYTPHSANIYILASYGLVALLAFYLVFFKLPKKNRIDSLLVMSPFLAIVTINTGLADYRFMTMLALIGACIRAKAVVNGKAIPYLRDACLLK